MRRQALSLSAQSRGTKSEIGSATRRMQRLWKRRESNVPKRMSSSIQRPQNMKKHAPLPMCAPSSGSTPFVRFTTRCLPLLPVALLLTTLSGCSSKSSVIQTLKPPPANLASPCSLLNNPPKPFLDPARLLWEKDLIERRNDCAEKHRLTIEAWKDAVAVK